jgi:hypothetical protein
VGLAGRLADLLGGLTDDLDQFGQAEAKQLVVIEG